MTRRALILFAVAWAVRLVYLAQIRSVPWFDVPIVDGANYVRTASLVASGDLLGGRAVFWQPPLYPYFLAALLLLFGPRMEAIGIVQGGVGAVSCVLAYLVGRRVFGERAGVAASLVMAFYGPLIHFDAQPLIPVLHIVLALAGLLALLRARGSPGVFAAGLLWGLAAIATPNILLAVPVAAWWLRRRRGSAGAGEGPPGVASAPGARRAAAFFLLGAAAPVALVTARNLAVAGQPVLISSNAGINLYIGNNPEYERTIRIRPGGEFERLAQEPENLGVRGAAEKSRYFARRALAFLAGSPGAAARLYLRKVLDLFAGREIPRNEDMYLYRRYSFLLAILLWRFGLSCPFGAIAPLALAGALLPPADATARARRRLLLGYGAAYAVSILVFFPTDRYRLPLVPVAALFAGNLLGAPASAWRRRAVLAGLGAGLLLFNLDAARPSEAYPVEEALNRAYALRVEGRTEEAKIEYRRAITLDPERIDPYNSLAALASQAGDWEEAAREYEKVLRIAPDFAEVRRSLGQAYLALGRPDEARAQWEIAVRSAPGAGPILADLCMSYFDDGALRMAEPYCDRAVAARPDLPDTHLARARVERMLGRTEEARREAAEAARLYAPGSAGWEKAMKILRRLSGTGEGDRTSGRDD
jgi:tetratricopeptide (TPR) repeat protein